MENVNKFFDTHAMKVFVIHVRPVVYGDVTKHMSSCADTATNLSGVFPPQCKRGLRRENLLFSVMANSAAFDGWGGELLWQSHRRL